MRSRWNVFIIRRLDALEQGFTITIEHLLHFLEYFDEKNKFHEELFLGFEEVPPIYHLLCFCTNIGFE